MWCNHLKINPLPTGDPKPIQRCLVSGFFPNAARLHYTGTYRLVCIFVYVNTCACVCVCDACLVCIHTCMCCVYCVCVFMCV